MGSNRKSHLKETIGKHLIPLFLSLFFILTIGYLITTPIRYIECAQRAQPCDETTMDKLAHLEGKSLFFYDLKKTLSQFEKYTYTKKIDGKLTIQIDKTAITFYNFDQNGIVSTSPELVLDKTLNQQLHILFTELEKYEINYDQIQLVNEVVVINLQEKKALLELSSSPEAIYKLSQIMRNIDFDEIDTSIVEIDLRFEMPVLKTRQTDL